MYILLFYNIMIVATHILYNHFVIIIFIILFRKSKILDTSILRVLQFIEKRKFVINCYSNPLVNHIRKNFLIQSHLNICTILHPNFLCI